MRTALALHWQENTTSRLWWTELARGSLMVGLSQNGQPTWNFISRKWSVSIAEAGRKFESTLEAKLAAEEWFFAQEVALSA